MRLYLYTINTSCCNGRFNVLSLLLGYPWVSGGGAVCQKYPGNKPQDACCTCKRATAV